MSRESIQQVLKKYSDHPMKIPGGDTSESH